MRVVENVFTLSHCENYKKMSVEKRAMSFHSEPGFCSNCGTILPLMSDVTIIKCSLCLTDYTPQAYGLMESQYVIHFHKPEDYLENSKTDEVVAEGPVVNRKCRKCGNDEMSYSTLQLRSADEGQTVFYKCTKCKFSESENS